MTTPTAKKAPAKKAAARKAPAKKTPAASSAPAIPPADLTLSRIPLAKLRKHPKNIRRNLGDLTDLAKSIESVGILEPLVIGPPDAKGMHLVFAGNRRHGAAVKAKGITDAPCIVRDLTEAQVLEVMLVENLQRNDVTPIEEAKAYGRLVELDTTVADIARTVGRSQQHVKGRLALLVLPDLILDLVDAGSLTLDTAASLTKYAADDDAMDWLGRQIKAKKMDARNDWQLREYIGERDRGREVVAIRAKVEKAGHRLWEAPLDQYQRPVPPQGDKYSTLSLTRPATMERLELTDAQAKKHGDEPCSAIWIRVPGRYDYGAKKPTAVHICTDPRRHTTKAKKADASEVQMKPSVYAKQTGPGGGRKGPAPKLSREMKANRRAHLAALVAGVRTLDERLLGLVLDSFRHAAGEGKKHAGEILVPGDGDGYSAFNKSHLIGNPAQVLVALALGQLEAQNWSEEAKGQYLAFLVATGYEPVDGETPWLEADMKAHDKRAAARDTEKAKLLAELGAAGEPDAAPAATA